MADSTQSSERVRKLEQTIRDLSTDNVAQKKRCAELERENQKLRQQLALAQRTSLNSSKRPSSDIVKPRPLKSASPRKIGAQPGHTKHERPVFPPEKINPLLPLAKILNIDETGHKDNGQRMQTWVFRARDYILFKIAETRSTAVLLETLGANFEGVIGSDYFSSYRCYMREYGGVLQFCLAHLIRDVKFLVSLPDAATRNYGERFLESLRKLFHIIHQRESLTATAFRSQLKAQRKQILSTALTGIPDNSYAQNLAKRLRENGASYFRFISTPGIEPTNNLAEQAIRFVVIDRHITQGTRSEAGRKWSERIWTAIATCHQQGISAYHYIRDAVQAYLAGEAAPTLLAASS